MDVPSDRRQGLRSVFKESKSRFMFVIGFYYLVTTIDGDQNNKGSIVSLTLNNALL